MTKLLHFIARFLKHWSSRDWFPSIIFTLAACSAMLPVLPQFNSNILGSDGDNVQYIYLTGRVAQSLQNGESIYFDPYLNYPGQLELAATDVPFLSMILATPFTLSFGYVFGYNLIILASHFFSGYFTYLWILRLTNSRFAGLIAGLSFLLAPYRIVHSYGHLQLVSTQFLPLFFWALDHASQAASPSKRSLVYLAISVILIGSSSQYYMIIALLCGAIYLILSAWQIKYLIVQGWKIALSVVIGAIFGSIPYLYNFIFESGKLYQPYTVDETRLWSNSISDFIEPSYAQWLWKDLMMENFSIRVYWVEHVAYIGLIALFLVLVGLFSKVNNYKLKRYTWLGVAVFAMVMSLGTDIWLRNQPLQSENPFLLPAAYLLQIPVLNLIRTWSRFSIITSLFISLLAGYGALILKQKYHWKALPQVLLIGLLALDLLPGHLENFQLEMRPIDKWLAEQPGEFAVAFLPPGIENYKAMYGALLHHKKLPAYNHPTHISFAFRQFTEASAGFPDPVAIQSLRGLNFRYLLLHIPSFGGRGSVEWKNTVTAIQDVDLEIIIEVGDYMVVGFSEEP